MCRPLVMAMLVFSFAGCGDSAEPGAATPQEFLKKLIKAFDAGDTDMAAELFDELTPARKLIANTITNTLSTATQISVSVKELDKLAEAKFGQVAARSLEKGMPDGPLSEMKRELTNLQIRVDGEMVFATAPGRKPTTLFKKDERWYFDAVSLIGITEQGMDTEKLEAATKMMEYLPKRYLAILNGHSIVAESNTYGEFQQKFRQKVTAIMSGATKQQEPIAPPE